MIYFSFTQVVAVCHVENLFLNFLVSVFGKKLDSRLEVPCQRRDPIFIRNGAHYIFEMKLASCTTL